MHKLSCFDEDIKELNLFEPYQDTEAEEHLPCGPLDRLVSTLPMDVDDDDTEGIVGYDVLVNDIGRLQASNELHKGTGPRKSGNGRIGRTENARKHNEWTY
ncbi:uncharacterized protein LOC117194721 [Drosophila miranda]|uniref:uncharacterized protein LOC117194721 n=1 Tax=Drosophila miranda TaxID=7229 RepID=UPI00143F0ECF|nr:uncharacterized protein LOC117194721 [Drosophila miranda]